MMEKTALIIVDAQVNMFDASNPVHNANATLEKLRTLVEQARGSRVAVIHVQNNGGPNDPDTPGAPGWEIHPALTPLPGEVVIQKETPDAFHATPLRQELEARGIQNLVIAGMQTDYCIDASARRAAELGYRVTLVEDAHSTYDDEQTAAEIIAQYNRELGQFVTLKKASEVVL